MAQWDEYTQKSTPEDADTLMIKDTAAGANKRTPFSGVWNWIVTKLTNAVISQLETSNKTVIGSLNELNSKSEFYAMQNSGETVILDPNPWDAYIAMLQHSGGNSYYIASIMNDANQNIKIGKVASNNDDMFSLTVDENKNVVISSSTRYWTCVLFNLNYKS